MLKNRREESLRDKYRKEVFAGLTKQEKYQLDIAPEDFLVKWRQKPLNLPMAEILVAVAKQHERLRKPLAYKLMQATMGIAP